VCVCGGKWHGAPTTLLGHMGEWKNLPPWPFSYSGVLFHLFLSSLLVAALPSLQHLNCKVQSAKCKVQTAKCKLQSAKCKTHTPVSAILQGVSVCISSNMSIASGDAESDADSFVTAKSLASAVSTGATPMLMASATDGNSTHLQSEVEEEGAAIGKEGASAPEDMPRERSGSGSGSEGGGGGEGEGGSARAEASTDDEDSDVQEAVVEEQEHEVDAEKAAEMKAVGNRYGFDALFQGGQDEGVDSFRLSPPFDVADIMQQVIMRWRLNAIRTRLTIPPKWVVT
jgi:hypothetical protein